MDKSPKGSECADDQNGKYINIEWDLLENVFKESTSDYIKAVNIIYEKSNEEDIDITKVYKNLGKMELINELIENEYYEVLLNAGTKIIEEEFNSSSN